LFIVPILFLVPENIFGQSQPASPQQAKDLVAQQLRSDFFQKLYRNTYENLISRVEPDGFLRESMTGAYVGMFPRTVGAIVSLFLETDELDRATG
jgi:hypothetical protein